MTDPRTNDHSYDPSPVEIDRARQQGSGMGQKDLDGQRDPTGARSAEPPSFSGDGEPEAGARGKTQKKPR